VLSDSPTIEAVSQLVNSADFEQLDDSAKAVIAASISNAPEDIKKEFESSVNVFEDEAFSQYVPSGSTVSVATRRTVVAVVAATAAAAQAAAASTSRPRP